MLKKNNFILILTTLLCLLPTIFVLSVFDKLPEQLPTHFNASGQVDGYTNKFYFLIGAPIISALLNLFVNFTIEADPKKNNQSLTIKLIAKFTIPITVIFVTVLTIFTALGYKVAVNLIVTIFLGIIFIIMGNYFPKTKQNYTIGIKLPWTLNNEDNWNKTHRLAGFLWVIGGSIIVITGLFQFMPILITLSVTSIISVIPCIYSYMLYKKYNS